MRKRKSQKKRKRKIEKNVLYIIEGRKGKHKREYLKEIVQHNLIREKEREWWEEILREKERERERV